MYEKKRIKRLLLRNTLLFFVAFSLIFTALGVFVYHVVSSNIYRAADQQLNSLYFSDTTIIGALDPLADTNVDNPDVATEDSEEETGDTNPDVFVFNSTTTNDDSLTIGIGSVLPNTDESPQVFYLLRNDQGDLVDATGFYGNTSQDFLEHIPFDPNRLEEIYQIEVNGSQYRTLSYSLDDASGNSYYLQALINVDSEIAILAQFTQTLVIGLLLALFACAGVSYLLSKRTIRPIVQAWENQTEFIQNASHELRTPLAVIHATQELLLEDPQGKIIDHFEDINLTLEESTRLRRLAEELLTLSVTDSKTELSHEEDLDLDQLIDNVADLHTDYAQTQGKSLNLDLTYGSTIHGDRSKVERTLNCLLENAFNYTEEGDSITISSSNEDNQAVISISDTGIGISEEDREHVFERFYRADKARTRKTEGAGLGLSIARDLVESQKGSIAIEPNQPKGTTATIRYPAK